MNAADMSIAGSLALVEEIAVQLRDQAAEEVAALVGFLESTGRSEVRFAIGLVGEWKYEYQAHSNSGYGDRRSVATARVARLFKHPGARQILSQAGPNWEYVNAVSVKYGFLRDQMGGFKNLVAAIKEELEKQLKRNSDGRSEALAELAGLSDGSAA